MSEWETREGKVVPKQVTKAQAALLRLRQVLLGMIEKDQARKAQAQAHLHRMKHGGGS